MPLDHFVSQVHLRNFYSPALGGEQMYGFRKRDGHVFPCRSKDVCRIEDGSTNRYLKHNRAIESFLKTIEPRYNGAIGAFREGSPRQEAVYVVAGFAAYVATCSPTAIRLGQNPLKSAVEATAKILDSEGALQRAPEILGSKTATQLIDDGDLMFNIDPKFPQALGITTILDRAGIWGNSIWDLIRNPYADNPFFTSDFPSAIEFSQHPGILNRLVPLAPDFAVRIRPDPSAKMKRGDVGFPGFRCRSVVAKEAEVRAINQAIVRCAEELVFFRDQRTWVLPFLKKNAAYWIEPLTTQVKVDKGFLNVSTMRIGSRS